MLLDVREFGCTFIHELAHIAGATTDKSKENPHRLDAERSLNFCLCHKKYNKENFGVIQVEKSFRVV